MGFKVTSIGNFKNTETYLFNHRKSAFSEDELIQVAEYGLSRFISNTPKKSGKTASSWSYEIVDVNGKKTITYSNDNIQNGLNIAILVDTGHALSNGKWMPGNPYIDKTIKEICSYIRKQK